MSAQPELGTALTDEDLAVNSPGGTGYGVGVVGRMMCGVDVPNLLAGRLVYRHEAGIEGGEVDSALVGGDAPVCRSSAAGVAHGAAVGLGIEPPDLLARLGIDGVDNAPRIREVHDPVDDQRRCLQAMRDVEVLDPGEAEDAHGVAVDLGECREPQFVVGLAVGEPATGFGRARPR